MSRGELPRSHRATYRASTKLASASREACSGTCRNPLGGSTPDVGGRNRADRYLIARVAVLRRAGADTGHFDGGLYHVGEHRLALQLSEREIVRYLPEHLRQRRTER